jgi:hypothetical protein
MSFRRHHPQRPSPARPEPRRSRLEGSGTAAKSVTMLSTKKPVTLILFGRPDVILAETKLTKLLFRTNVS